MARARKSKKRGVSRTSTRKTAKKAKRSTSKKSSSKKKKVVRKAAPKRKAAKKTTKSAKKVAKRKATKKPVKKAAPKRKATKKPTRKATTTRSSPSVARSSSADTQVKQLEIENQKLLSQLQASNTKEAVVNEVRSYMDNLKDELRYQTQPEKNEEYNNIVDKLEDTNAKLVEQMQRTDSKDKIITKLKSLLAAGQKKAPAQEEVKQKIVENVSPQQKATEEEVPNEYKSDDNRAVEVQEKAEAPKAKPVKEHDFQSARTSKGDISSEEAAYYGGLIKEMRKSINQVFIGQEDVVEKTLISLMCDAHTLLEGVPGLAKTLLVETMAKTLGGTTFKRIQFLPDLLPSDIIGGQVFNPKTAEFKTFKGPIFANFVLCDEINRAPPKTHAAVMEAMQEKKINIENEEFILDRPFFVLATQNPLENKGTYELPEAVLDRFMFKVILDYPARKDEIVILTENATTKALKDTLKPVMQKQELLTLQKKVKTVFVSHRIKEFILDLVEATRGKNKHIEGFKFVKYGAGVRAGIYLILASKAKAVIEGRNYVLPDDVLSIAGAVLRHRISLNFRGKAHNISAEKVMEEIFMKVNIV